MIDDLKRLDGPHAADYDHFLAEFGVISQMTDDAMAVAMLDKNVEAMRIMSPVNGRILALNDDLTEYARQRAASNLAHARELAQAARRTQTAMIVFGVSNGAQK